MKNWLEKYGLRLLLGWGLCLRLFHLFINRDLFHDEAALALNIRSKSFLELTAPLDFGQAAPIGFLWLEKLSYQLFAGISPDFALRFPPFLMSILALLLFIKFSKQLFPPIWAVIAVAFFVFNEHIMHYSVEVKQYIFDVGIGLFLLKKGWEIMSTISQNNSSKKLFQFGILGAILLWFSQPSVFVLASCSLVFFLLSIFQKATIKTKNVWFSGTIWVASFAIYFFFFLQQNTDDAYLQRFHTPFFMPLDFWKIESLLWYKNTLLALFKNPAGFGFAGLAVVVFLLGVMACFSLPFTNTKRKKIRSIMLLLPFLFALFASAFGKYSTIPRLMLFTAPLLIFYVVFGLQFIEKTLKKYAPKWTNLTFVIAILLVAQAFLNTTIHQIAEPKKVEEITTCLAFIEKNKTEKEVLYVYPGAEFQFNYYAPNYDLSGLKIQQGIHPHHWKKWGKEIQQLRKKERVWLLLSHTGRMSGENDMEIYPEKMRKMGGKILLSETDKGVRCILYEFAR